MERPDFLAEGFPIQIAGEAQPIRINTAAYADYLILYSDTGHGIRKYLDLLAKFCSYTGMKINVKKCVSLVEIWNGDKQEKVKDPFYYRQYLGLDSAGNQPWDQPEQLPMHTSSLYLGTAIAFNREDEAKHGKHIIDSMKENIDQIGRSHSNITQKLHTIKTFELPRIYFRMMGGDLASWLRGRVASWLGTRGIVTEVFLMSWRDGGFTLPSLGERQHMMVIRTIFDMMSTTDISLLKIMRQFELEEAEQYGCAILER
jgi:hypothetical protein